jgi:hypothetical protein
MFGHLLSREATCSFKTVITAIRDRGVGGRPRRRGGQLSLTFWLQTIFLAYFCIAQRRHKSYLPAATVADGR